MSKTSTPQAIRGTQDIFGAEAEAFAFVVETFERVRKLYRFRRVEMPVFERTEVFSRGIGETTDVVSKEMYSFTDRDQEWLTLRPEFTAGIARAYLSEGWSQFAPIKVATHGPLFRYERPQKGRYRQFHQVDAEIIGSAEPQADIELLVMADQFIKELGVSEGVRLHLNTLGDAQSREAWRSVLVDYFDGCRSRLSVESQRRILRNPLRILDSKDEQDRVCVEAAPTIDEYLTPEAQRFFDDVVQGLKDAGIKPQINKHLVRGLDYYRHTAFEFVPDAGSAAASKLGSQSTILGGGRYDGLLESLGGTETPAVGWAAGIERLAMLVGVRPDFGEIFGVISEDRESQSLAQEIASTLRSANLRVDQSYLHNPRKQMDKLRRREITTAIYVRTAVYPDDALATIRIKRFRSFSHPISKIIGKRLENNYQIVARPADGGNSFDNFDFLLVRRK